MADNPASGDPASEPFHYDGDDLEALTVLDNYTRAIFAHFAPHVRGRVIELGAGLGSFSRRILPQADRLDLVEPSPNLVVTLRTAFAGDARVTVHGTSLETHLTGMEAESVDAAVLVNVLEHIEDDRGALAGLTRILRPGGHLLICVPALPFLFSRMDQKIGHFRRYLRQPLADLATEAGLQVVRAVYFDVLGILPWYLVFTLGGRTRVDPASAALYDRIGVPVSQALERILPMPFGKNVILVARKPETAPPPTPAPRAASVASA